MRVVAAAYAGLEARTHDQQAIITLRALLTLLAWIHAMQPLAIKRRRANIHSHQQHTCTIYPFLRPVVLLMQ